MSPDLDDTCPTCGKRPYDFGELHWYKPSEASEVVECENGHRYKMTWRLVTKELVS